MQSTEDADYSAGWPSSPGKVAHAEVIPGGLSNFIFLSSYWPQATFRTQRPREFLLVHGSCPGQVALGSTFGVTLQLMHDS